MNTKLSRLITAVVLAALFFLSVFSIIGQRGDENTVGILIHIWSGSLMALGSLWHLIAHRDWIKTVYTRPMKDLKPSVRRNWNVDLGLFFSLILLAVSGVAIALFPSLVVMDHLHRVSGMAFIAFEIAHLVFHRRWMRSGIRELFA